MSEYEIIPPEQVRPGDMYKFIPVLGEPVFHPVLAVRLDKGLVRIGITKWAYIKPPLGEVVFARKKRK